MNIKNQKLIRPFQEDAVEFLNKRNGIGLLGMEMGLGKTLCALMYVVEKDLKTLVICPNSLKYVWVDEIEKWTDLSCNVIDSKKKTNDFSGNITIINYDIVHKFFDITKKGRGQWFNVKPQFQDFFKELKCVVVDESHYIKSQKARRSKATKQINPPHKILLTGTPLTNKPLDIWNQLNYLDKDNWGNWVWFRDTFIEGYHHPRLNFFIETGTKNIKELSKLIKPYIFRRRKEDVLKELPPKIYNKIGIDISGEHWKMYQQALKDFREFLLQFTELTNKEIWRRLRAETFTKVMALKQICSNYKCEKIVKDFTDNILENNPDDKIVIFTQYRSVALKLSKMLTSSVLIYGDVDTKERAKLVKKFQEDDKIKYFIGTIQTSGVGLTLTKASNVIFVDLPWTPAEINQAIDRTHRFGQTKSVNVYYLVGKNSIENKIYNLLAQKSSLIDQILDGDKIKKGESVKNAFLKAEIFEVQKQLKI